MNTRLIIFGVAAFLAAGAVLVFALNNFKSAKSTSSNQYKLDTIQGPKVENSSPSTSQIVTSLQIVDEKEGTGSAVKNGDIVEVNYLGTLLNGQKFDSSYDRNQTFSFTVGGGQVIKGWDEGLIGMKVGGKRKLTIPASLGYGDQGNGPIPPNSSLIFEIELVSVK